MRLRRRIPVLLEVGVIPLGIVLLQAHGVPFWRAIVGFNTGMAWVDWAPAILWSGTLEWINVWQWGFKRGYTIGAITALLLVTGPMVEVGMPLYRSLAAEIAAPSSASDAERRVAYYRALVEKRSGWQDDLRRAETDSAQATTLYVTRLPAAHIIRTSMLLITLILFAGAVPMALRSLNTRSRAAKQTTLDRIQEVVRAGRAPEWMSKHLAESLLTHYEREAMGRSVLSPTTIARLGRRMHLS